MRRLLAPLVVLLTLVAVAPASAYVYWVNSPGASPTIARANNDGTEVDVDFIPNPGAGTTTLAVNGTHLFWGHSSGQTPRSIGQANVDGTGVDPSYLAVGNDAVYSLNATAEELYWSNGSAVRHHNFSLGTGTVFSEPESGWTITQLAVTDTSIFRERQTTTGSASAEVVRRPLGSSTDTVFPRTGGSLDWMVTNGSALYGSRGLSQANATRPIVTAGFEPSDTVGEVVPGDGAYKWGLGMTGCHLFWSASTNENGGTVPDAIATAKTDGTELNRALVSGPGVVISNGSDVAADLKPTVTETCSAGTPPQPPPTDAPPPSGTPSPATPPPPLTLPPSIAGLTEAQLKPFYWLANSIFATQDPLPPGAWGNPKAQPRPTCCTPEYLVAKEILAFFDEIDMRDCGPTMCAWSGSFPGGVSAVEALLGRAAAPYSSSIAHARIGGAATYTPAQIQSGMQKLKTALERLRKEQLVTARLKQRHASKRKLKKAAQAVDRAAAAVKKLRPVKLRLKPTPRGRALRKRLSTRTGRKLKRVQPVYLELTLTDPTSRATVKGTQRLKLSR